MYVRRIRIENVRCFRSGALAVDLDLRRPDGTFAGWTVVAGRNGAGKTTFGLEHPHSDRSERLRRRLAELEFKLMRGKLSAEDLPQG
jgi:hypothetical protein